MKGPKRRNEGQNGVKVSPACRSHLIRLVRVDRLLDLLSRLLLNDQLLRLVLVVHLRREVILNSRLILMINDLSHVCGGLEKI